MIRWKGQCKGFAQLWKGQNLLLRYWGYSAKLFVTLEGREAFLNARWKRHCALSTPAAEARREEESGRQLRHRLSRWDAGRSYPVHRLRLQNLRGVHLSCMLAPCWSFSWTKFILVAFVLFSLYYLPATRKIRQRRTVCGFIVAIEASTALRSFIFFSTSKGCFILF